MNITDEQDVKRQLGIETWRDLSKEKMLSLVSMLPDLDTNVAVKIVEQFPSFKEFGERTLEATSNAHASTLSENRDSTNQAHDAWPEIRTILRTELANDDLTWDQRKWVIEQIQDSARQQTLKDSENKRFLDTSLGKALAGTGMLVVVGLTALGGRAQAHGQS